MLIISCMHVNGRSDSTGFVMISSHLLEILKVDFSFIDGTYVSRECPPSSIVTGRDYHVVNYEVLQSAILAYHPRLWSGCIVVIFVPINHPKKNRVRLEEKPEESFYSISQSFESAAYGVAFVRLETKPIKSCLGKKINLQTHIKWLLLL